MALMNEQHTRISHLHPPSSTQENVLEKSANTNWSYRMSSLLAEQMNNLCCFHMQKNCGQLSTELPMFSLLTRNFYDNALFS